VLRPASADSSKGDSSLATSAVVGIVVGVSVLVLVIVAVVVRARRNRAAKSAEGYTLGTPSASSTVGDTTRLDGMSELAHRA
jgi:hypothetical protein